MTRIGEEMGIERPFGVKFTPPKIYEFDPLLQRVQNHHQKGNKLTDSLRPTPGGKGSFKARGFHQGTERPKHRRQRSIPDFMVHFRPESITQAWTPFKPDGSRAHTRPERAHSMAERTHSRLERVHRRNKRVGIS